MVRYSLEERIFIYNNYIKTKSIKECRKRFRNEYPLGKVPSKPAILQLIKRVRKKGTVWKSNETHRPQKIVLTEEKIDEIGAQLEQCPEKSLARMAQDANISKSSARRATKLLLRTSSEFKEKLKKVKREADQNETNSIQQSEVHISQTTVKIEKMDEDEQEQQLEQLEEDSLEEDPFKMKQEYDMNVKEEPQSEDEDLSNDYVPALKIEEINVKKEEFE